MITLKKKDKEFLNFCLFNNRLSLLIQMSTLCPVKCRNVELEKQISKTICYLTGTKTPTL